MAQPTASKVALIKDRHGPVVLVGPPRELRGELHVQNPGDEKVIVRRPFVTATATEASQPVTLRDSTIVLRRIVVRPGQSRHVPIALALDATTPPGTYQAQLNVDSDQHDVLIHVTEDTSFSMDPHELVIPNRPGEQLQKRVVITNTGNVPLMVKSVGGIVLDEELVHCRALRGALADVGATLKSLDDFVVALGRRYHDLYESLILTVQNDAVTVNPGETEAVDLIITVPKKLDKRGRYTGSAPISTQSLSFTIVPQ